MTTVSQSCRAKKEVANLTSLLSHRSWSLSRIFIFMLYCPSASLSLTFSITLHLSATHPFPPGSPILPVAHLLPSYCFFQWRWWLTDDLTHKDIRWGKVNFSFPPRLWFTPFNPAPSPHPTPLFLSPTSCLGEFTVCVLTISYFSLDSSALRCLVVFVSVCCPLFVLDACCFHSNHLCLNSQVASTWNQTKCSN